MTRRGLTIALSGVDCSGKSTQRDLLMAALRSWGNKPVTIWTRAGSTRGLKAVKRVVFALTGKKKRDPGHVADKPGKYPRRASNLPNPIKRRIWLTAALLDLLWVYVFRLRWWGWCGRTVVCDRYLLDCLVDFRVNFPDDRVEDRLLCRWLRRFSVRPDVAFCLLTGWIPVLSLSRFVAVGGPDGLGLVLLGGLFYTGGTVFLMNDHRNAYLHGVWHVSTLAGSGCHYAFLMSYVAAA